MEQARLTTMRKMYYKALTLSLIVFAGPAKAVDAVEFPRFRHVDKLAVRPDLVLPPKITLLADEDFAPFSFKAIDAKPAGISQQLALTACTQLKISCEIKLLPYASLLAALRLKQGDVVLGGPSAENTQAQGYIATRPYYYSFSRFLARSGVNFPGVDSKSLAGRRLGAVHNSAQEQFLKKNFPRSSLVVFESSASLFEAIRTAGVDLALVDSTFGGFWLKGENARGCCVAVGNAFLDKSNITRGMVMALRPEDKALRAAFDYALDQAQETGTTAKIFQAYLPASPF